MSWLAVWLLAVGVSDLVRSLERPQARRVAPAAGVAVLVMLALCAGLTRPVDLVVLAMSVAPLLGWLAFSGRMLRTGRGHLAALACLLGGATVMLALSGAASPVGGAFARWLAWADLPGVDAQRPGHTLLVAALLVANLSTANLVVRCVLVGVGAMRPREERGEPQPSDRLRGGRLLGPMERVFILGLGLAGEVTAASLVIAAKGLLRFPELQSRRREGELHWVGIDAVTEYFLVGSFVSWLIALGSLALTR